MYFSNYRLKKTWLDKCLNSPVSEHPLKVKMLKAPKRLQNLHGSHFITFFITMSETELEMVPVTGMWTIRTLCLNIDC